MSMVPTDSVLKRHYDQMRQAGVSPTSGGRCAPAGGGLFGWLKRLFCG